MRLPEWTLPHPLTVQNLAAVGSSVGDRFAEPRSVAGLFVEEPSEVIDSRPDSNTRDQTIVSRAQFVVQFEDGPIPPGSRVKHAGKTWTVVQAARNDHPDAPSSTQGWVI